MCREREGSSPGQWKRSDGDVDPEKALANPVGSPGASSACGGSYMKPSCLLDQGTQPATRKSVPREGISVQPWLSLKELAISGCLLTHFHWLGIRSFLLREFGECVSMPTIAGVFICRNMAPNPIPLVALSSLTMKTSPRSSLCNLQQSKFSLPLTSFL